MWSTFGLVLSLGFLAWALLRVLSVDLGAIVTNDSIGYLGRAKSPFSEGLMVQGYRQIGYPLFLWASDGIDGLLPWDRLLGVAILQRGLLIVGLVLTWYALRLWAIPVLAFVAAPTYVVHTDLVLNEGLLIPLGLIVAAMTAAVFRDRSAAWAYPGLTLSVIALLTTSMALLKLQFAALMVLGVAAAIVLVRQSPLTARRAGIVLGSAGVVIIALLIGQSIENRAETGVLEPVSEQARADWYGAYQVTFTLRPGNQQDPSLTEWYDEGNLYTFLHGLERQEPDYRVRRTIIERRVKDLFAAAGTSSPREQVASFLGALGGGRMDDISGIIDGALDESPDARERHSYNSLVAGGATVVLTQVNDDEPSGELSIAVLGDVILTPVGDHRPFTKLIGYASILVLVVSLVVRGRQRLLAGAGLLLAVGIAGVLATAYIDNARYLLTAVTVTLVVALTCSAELTDRFRSRAADSPIPDHEGTL